MLLQPRHVGVRVHRQPVRPDRQDVVDRGAEGVHGLKRQPVDQVHVDAVEAHAARGRDECARLLERLDPVDRFLHGRIEVLHPHREPIETGVPECFEVRLRRDPRIDFDADLRVG